MDCSIDRHIVRSKLFKAPGQPSGRLTVFFSGWATDEGLMEALFPSKDGASVLPDGGGDILLCYGHQDYVLNKKLFEYYSRIRLVAWSLGVWASEFACGAEDLHFEECIAVNGTVFPVDDSFGIPLAVYKGTLDNLNERNLYKFRMRMCGGKENYERFMTCAPKRTMEDIKEELESILLRSRAVNWAHNKWDKAIVCSSDAIFPPQNQIAGWRERGVDPVVMELPHFSPEVLRELLIFEA